MAGIMCVSGAVLMKAGSKHNAKFSGANSDALIDPLINQAESYINVATGVNFSDTYATLNADVKKILEDAASSHAAIAVINHDMSGYISRTEAQTMLNVNYTRLNDIIKLLKEKKGTDFVTGA